MIQGRWGRCRAVREGHGLAGGEGGQECGSKNKDLRAWVFPKNKDLRTCPGEQDSDL